MHFAATSADLPACDEITNGRLYYVEFSKYEQFQVCRVTAATWAVDISNHTWCRSVILQDGAPGVDGADGQIEFIIEHG